MRYPAWYSSISEPFRAEGVAQAINVADRALVYAIAAAYVLTIVSLLVTGNVAGLIRVIAVPAAAFALTTFLRNRLNAPRPYELYDIDPIIQKDTNGKSMPSRHVTSAAIIAFAIAWVHPDWGAIAVLACAIVAATRVIGGVHFPRDVVAALALASACGLIGFVWIP